MYYANSAWANTKEVSNLLLQFKILSISDLIGVMINLIVITDN